MKLPKVVKDRHKYQAGYVVAFAGSKEMPGAAKLAGLAALRSGSGIVRIFSPSDIGQGPLELILSRWSAKAWEQELKKATALFIGPGLGNQMGWLKKQLPKISVPCVIDADALVAGVAFPKNSILTPHLGELKNLKLEKEGIQTFCNQKDLILVLKGAPTTIFAPNRMPLEIHHGDPGMATAGSGDVLTGIIASFLAQGLRPYEAATLGVTCHGIAGEEAARVKTSRCMIASDLIEFLPAAFRILETSGKKG